MAEGIIKKLVTDRGFGFITPEGEAPNGKDLFFHRADLKGVAYETLREGQEVTYEIGTDARRGTPIATQVALKAS